MEYKVEASEKSTVKVTINFSAEEWKSANETAYLKTRSKYRVPGFRPGKAPKKVIENFYGKGAFYDEALNTLFSDNYMEILNKEQANFTAVGDPAPTVDDLSDDGVTISCIIPVKPDIQISAYTGLTIKQYNYTVTEEDVQARINSFLSKNATDVEVTDRPCQNDDTVNINFEGKIDGVAFPGGTAEEYDLVLGSGSFIPGFEDQVCGMNIGDVRDITVTFPEGYQAEELRGKDAVFTIKLNGITAKQLPELTDEYVKSHSGYETVEAFTAHTKELLEKEAERKSVDQTENSIVMEICKNATGEIPQAMIDSEIDRQANAFVNQLNAQGLNLDDYLQYMQMDMAKFRAGYEENAKRTVLSHLVVEKIIKEQGFKPETEEVDAEIAELAASVEKSAEEYKKSLNPQQLEYIMSDIVVKKLFNYLKENNTLVD